MINAPESPETAAAHPVGASETLNHRQGKSDPPTSMVCDLSEAKAFCLGFGMPNVPVLAAFGGGRLHAFRLDGSWDLDRAASENADAMVRSIRRLPSKDT